MWHVRSRTPAHLFYGSAGCACDTHHTTRSHSRCSSHKRKRARKHTPCFLATPLIRGKVYALAVELNVTVRQRFTLVTCSFDELNFKSRNERDENLEPPLDIFNVYPHREIIDTVFVHECVRLLQRVATHARSDIPAHRGDNVDVLGGVNLELRHEHARALLCLNVHLRVVGQCNLDNVHDVVLLVSQVSVLIGTCLIIGDDENNVKLWDKHSV